MKLLPILTATVIAASVTTQAQEWPQWGGNDPGRNMYSPAKGLPDSFEPGKLKSGTEEIDLSTTQNVKWAVKLGSQTYGNPVVSGGKVFVGTNNESPRDKAHVGDRSILLVFDEKTGELLWQLVVPKLKSGKVNDWENLGLLSSPLVVGNRLYLVTSRCEVICLDTEGMKNGNDGDFKDEGAYMVKDTPAEGAGLEPGPRDADIIWVYDMMDELGVFPHNAANSSVILVDGLLYICTSNGQDWTHVNIPSPNSPSFIALDPRTGSLVAEDNAGIGPRIFHGQWTSPSAGQVNGKWQIYFGGGDGVCYAFDAKPQKGTGAAIVPVLPGTDPQLTEETDVDYLRKVWWVDLNPPEYKVRDGKPIKYPAAEGPSEINSTPVFYKGRVYVASGQDPEHGEGVGRLVCIDPTRTGDLTKTGVVWEYRGIKRSISTVSIDPATGLLFIADFSGYVHCLDVDTGKLNWVYDMKAHMWGSTFVADGKVYVGDEDGDVVVLKADRTLKLISETNVGAPVYSTPIVVIITFLSIVFGELVPKRLAQGNPETIARIVAAPMQLLALIVRPFVSLLTSTTELVLAIFPRRIQEQPSVTEEEIEALLEEGSDAGVIEAQEHQMVRNVFRLDDRQITSLMVPRSELVALDAEVPTEDNLAVIAASDHSRFPVLRGDSREIVGIVSAKHLLNQFLRKEAADIQRAMQPAVFVPETLTGMELLENFRASSTSMVVVMDEYGQPQGIVTEQDVFEAIAGEFKPQHADDAWSIQREDGSWLLDGLIPIPELKDLLGLLDVPEEDKGRYHTLAGMLMLLLGRLPHAADQVDWAQWRFEVVDLDGHRIDKVIAKRMTEPGDADA